VTSKIKKATTRLTHTDSNNLMLVYKPNNENGGPQQGAYNPQENKSI